MSSAALSMRTPPGSGKKLLLLLDDRIVLLGVLVGAWLGDIVIILPSICILNTLGSGLSLVPKEYW